MDLYLHNPIIAQKSEFPLSKFIFHERIPNRIYPNVETNVFIAVSRY